MQNIAELWNSFAEASLSIVRSNALYSIYVQLNLPTCYCADYTIV